MTEEPTVTYTTSSGAVFEFDADHALMISDDERSWEFSTDAAMPVLEPRTLDARLVYVGEGMRDECARLLALAFGDLESGTPGTYRVGDWSINCYLLKGEAYSSMPEWAGWKVKLYAPDPVWRRETSVSLPPGSGEDVSGEVLDYPHGYPHDFGVSALKGSQLLVPGHLPCDLRIRFYGYAVAPYISVAGNIYQVNVTVPDGAYLTVDPLRKSLMAGDSVTLTGVYGDVQDVFSKRRRGAEGSGSYIFQRVPPGLHQVSWPQSFGVDLTVIERRAALSWT